MGTLLYGDTFQSETQVVNRKGVDLIDFRIPSSITGNEATGCTVIHRDAKVVKTGVERITYVLRTIPGTSGFLGTVKVEAAHAVTAFGTIVEYRVFPKGREHIVIGGIYSRAHIFRLAPGAVDFAAQPQVNASLTTRTIAGKDHRLAVG